MGTTFDDRSSKPGNFCVARHALIAPEMNLQDDEDHK